jgi:hypothetical protein
MDEQSPSLPSTERFIGDGRASFFGDPFTAEEVTDATRTLFERGLIRGSKTGSGRVLLRPTITDDGRDCVERFDSDVAAWTGRFDGRGGDVVTTNTTITNSPGVNWMQNSPGGSQSSTVGDIAVDARRQIVSVADEMLRVAKDVDGLGETQRAEVATAAEALRDEASQPSADEVRVRSLIGTVMTAAATALGTEAGKQLIQLAGQAMQALAN